MKLRQVLIAFAALAAAGAAHAAAPDFAPVKAATAALVAAAPAFDASPAGLDKPPVSWRTPEAGQSFRDIPEAPEMVVVPAGEFTMGSPASEPGRLANEGPRHRVRIGYAFAVSKYAVTVGQWAAFVKDTGYQMDRGACYFYKDAHYQNTNACSWRTPGFAQGDNQPVVAVGWRDATAYVAWLSKETGQTYRLLSEAEFEYAARAGTTTAYWWGDDPLAACTHANGSDKRAITDPQFVEWRFNACDDGYVYTAPVDAYDANAFGLYGMAGNAFTFTDDCWNETYVGAPADGSSFATGICRQRVVRGGAWAEKPSVLRSAARNWNYFEVQPVTDGLRIVRVL